MKVIFLDIDGVLNGHDWDEPAQSCRIRYQCIQAFNAILAQCDPKIVLSSARTQEHGGSIRFEGIQ